MRNFIFLITGLLLIILLGACGSHVTKEEVVNKAFEKSITSVEADMQTYVNIKFNGQEANQTSDIDLKYINEPFITHLTINTINGAAEIYINDKNAYILAPGKANWIKTPSEGVNELEEIANGESIKEDLKNLKKFSDVFKLEKIKEEYVLKATINESSPEKDKELVKETLEESFKDQHIELEKINKFDYTLTLDKNFNLKSVLLDLDSNITENGKSKQAVIGIKANYKNINKLKDFSVPQEIKQSAIERNLGN
jgi:hypothetical protein